MSNVIRELKKEIEALKRELSKKEQALALLTEGNVKRFVSAAARKKMSAARKKFWADKKKKAH
jgi:hypothetical protein